MKKSTRLLSLLLVAILFIGIFAACGKARDMTQVIVEKNLIDTAKCVTSDGKQAVNGKLSGTAGTYVDITFPEKMPINTVTLREKSDDVEAFEIAAKNGDQFETIYQSDKIEAFRYCAFPEVVTDALRITFQKADETFDISGIGVYQVKRQDAEQFRVTSYVVADRIYDKQNIDPKHFDVITDAILFGTTTFDENGSLAFHESMNIAGGKQSGQTVFETALQNLRETTVGKDVKIYCNLLGPDAPGQYDDWDDQMDAKAKLHVKAMQDNQEKLIQEIVAFVDQYDLDGIFFDWEYPIKGKYWKVFDSFVIALKQALGDRLVGTAVASWDAKFSSKAIESLDLVEVMAYDLFDSDGYHAPFYACGPQALQDMVKRGYPLNKCDLGVPFYARPTPEGQRDLWLDYKLDAERLGKYGNLATGTLQYDNEHTTDLPRYYNGYQMVYDKTAYAIDAGAGGMMVWHYACDLPYDNELSLFRAMGDAIRDRT